MSTTTKTKTIRVEANVPPSGKEVTVSYDKLCTALDANPGDIRPLQFHVKVVECPDNAKFGITAHQNNQELEFVNKDDEMEYWTTDKNTGDKAHLFLSKGAEAKVQGKTTALAGHNAREDYESAHLYELVPDHKKPEVFSKFTETYVDLNGKRRKRIIPHHALLQDAINNRRRVKVHSDTRAAFNKLPAKAKNKENPDYEALSSVFIGDACKSGNTSSGMIIDITPKEKMPYAASRIYTGVKNDKHTNASKLYTPVDTTDPLCAELGEGKFVAVKSSDVKGLLAKCAQQYSQLENDNADLKLVFKPLKSPVVETPSVAVIDDTAHHDTIKETIRATQEASGVVPVCALAPGSRDGALTKKWAQKLVDSVTSAGMEEKYPDHCALVHELHAHVNSTNATHDTRRIAEAIFCAHKEMEDMRNSIPVTLQVTVQGRHEEDRVSGPTPGTKNTGGDTDIDTVKPVPLRHLASYAIEGKVQPSSTPDVMSSVHTVDESE